jgi:hypothetical protein
MDGGAPRLVLTSMGPGGLWRWSSPPNQSPITDSIRCDARISRTAPQNIVMHTLLYWIHKVIDTAVVIPHHPCPLASQLLGQMFLSYLHQDCPTLRQVMGHSVPQAFCTSKYLWRWTSSSSDVARLLRHHYNVTKFYFRLTMGTKMAIPEISLKTHECFSAWLPSQVRPPVRGVSEKQYLRATL